jgi:glycosyltransferase involved in cell wall biosynthesis
MEHGMTAAARRTRPHVLAVAHSAECYGADRCLQAALPALLEVGDVTVAVPSDGPGIAVMEHIGARVVQLPDFAMRRRYMRPAQLVPWLGRVRHAVRELQNVHSTQPIDVVWSNTLAATLGPLLARRLSARHVLHVHECPDDPKWLPRVLLATSRADAVICNSQFTADWVARQRPALADKSVVVHNGIDLPPVPARPASDAGHTDGFRIACVARIHPKKGHLVLFDALRRARDEGRRWHVDVFGDTLPEHEPLHAEMLAFLRTHALLDEVSWHGFVPDVQEQYEQADVAVVPSVQPEEFSLVCLEAMAMVEPVVATGPGGASEVVVDGTTGLIVPPGDPVALHDALATLHDDPSRRAAMGTAGRARAETAFSRVRYAAAVRGILLDGTASASGATAGKRAMEDAR